MSAVMVGPVQLGRLVQVECLSCGWRYENDTVEACKIAKRWHLQTHRGRRV